MCVWQLELVLLGNTATIFFFWLEDESVVLNKCKFLRKGVLAELRHMVNCRPWDEFEKEIKINEKKIVFTIWSFIGFAYEIPVCTSTHYYISIHQKSSLIVCYFIHKCKIQIKKNHSFDLLSVKCMAHYIWNLRGDCFI